MLRIRWFDAGLDRQVTPLAWPYTALMTATLFLNFPFWFEECSGLGVPGTLLQYAGILILGSLLIAGLFFAGPALASYTAKRPLLNVVESSLGTVPAWLIRICCACFLIVWIADLISWPASHYVTFIFRRDVSLVEAGSIAGALLVFLFVTGLQSFRTSANLAFFSNKLGFVILVAALIRVHDGLPAALNGFPVSGGTSRVSDSAYPLLRLALYVGPLVFLAADFGHRMQGRRQVAMTAGVGIVWPLSATVLLVGVIGLATLATPYYQPSAQPSVAMALWSKVAGSALPGRMMTAAITIFGAVRFGARALKSSVSTPSFGRRPLRVLLVCFCGMIVWYSLHPFDANLRMSFTASAVCLTVAAGVVTGDSVSGRCWSERVQRIDLVGLSAFAAGLAMAFFVRRWVPDPWWEPEVFPAYVVGFMISLLGRMLHKNFARVSIESSSTPLG